MDSFIWICQNLETMCTVSPISGIFTLQRKKMLLIIHSPFCLAIKGANILSNPVLENLSVIHSLFSRATVVANDGQTSPIMTSCTFLLSYERKTLPMPIIRSCTHWKKCLHFIWLVRRYRGVAPFQLDVHWHEGWGLELAYWFFTFTDMISCTHILALLSPPSMLQMHLGLFSMDHGLYRESPTERQYLRLIFV